VSHEASQPPHRPRRPQAGSDLQSVLTKKQLKFLHLSNETGKQPHPPRWRGFAIRARSIHVMALTATAMQDFFIFAV
jgi:hypothetical protein